MSSSATTASGTSWWGAPLPPLVPAPPSAQASTYPPALPSPRHGPEPADLTRAPAPLAPPQENPGGEPTPGGLGRSLTLEKLLSRSDAELVAMLGSGTADNLLNLSNTFGSGDLDHLVRGAAAGAGAGRCCC
jgi:hypothetical protein